MSSLISISLDRLLISSDLRKDVINIVCKSGHQNYEIIESRSKKIEKTCSECGEKIELVEREDVVKHLIELAEYRGTVIEFVSTDFEEGNQLLHAFGGVAGVLRFPTNI